MTKNGASFVALIDARKLDYYHALEEEHADLARIFHQDADFWVVLGEPEVAVQNGPETA